MMIFSAFVIYVYVTQLQYKMSGAGKNPQKNEDNPNLTKVKEKVQRLFGFGKATAPPSVPKTFTREIVFTTEILKVSVEISNISIVC